MKNESAYAKKLTALLKKVRDAHKPAPLPEHDPVTHLVLAFLQWNSSRKLAEAAYARLMAPMVDNNDLRVSHQIEMISLIGTDYPRVEERAARLHETLQEIYNREHGVTLAAVAAAGKKQARMYLDSLPGMVSYVTSRVMLAAMGAHAIPVDDLLREKLVAEEAVEPDATVEEISAFLERQVKAGEGMAVHLALEEWSTAGGIRKTAPARSNGVKPASPAPAAAKPPAKDEGGSASPTKAEKTSAAKAEKPASARPATAKAVEGKAESKTSKKTTKKPADKPAARTTKKGTTSKS